jgi:hypothetical protein
MKPKNSPVLDDLKNGIEVVEGVGLCGVKIGVVSLI